MVSLFDTVGLVLRGGAALGLAALCGWSSVALGSGQAAWLAVLGQGGPLVIAMLGAVGLFSGVYCLISLSRGTRRGQVSDNGAHDFDPDAIIARHVARKIAATVVAESGQHCHIRQLPRPTFGRRVA